MYLLKVDGTEPTLKSAKTVLVSSPDNSVYK